MANYFASNLKYLREKQGLSQNKLAEKVGVNQTTIARWETEEIKPSIDNVEQIASALNVSLPDLLITNLKFDNGSIIDVETDTVQIPVLGIIKAGIAIEAQQDILEYIDIPKAWTRGGKSFYGLQISGDSMFPKYENKDIVIFEQTNDYQKANGKDCAVMVNGDDATFKKVFLDNEGMTLQAYNNMYPAMRFNKEQIENKPVRIIGIAKEKRTRL